MMLKNKVALVTGGTSGIGRTPAIAFGAAGAKVGETACFIKASMVKPQRSIATWATQLEIDL